MQRTDMSRRSFLQLAAGSTAVAALAACAPPVPAGTTTDASAEPITLNFFNRGGQFIENVMDQQMSLYRESNPNIEFEINAVAGASHQEALLIMISAGTGPDMWFDANRTTGPLTRKGVTTNLEPYFEADPDFNEDDYVENVWIAQTYDGARWGIPWDSGAMLMAFNIDLFDEAGVPHPEPDQWMTWDEIVELAKVLTFDLDDNTANDSGFDPARVRQYGLRAGKGHGRPTYIWGNDAEVIADDGTMPMDTDEFIEAMNWLADLGLKYYVNPSPAYEAAGEISLQAGTVAMQHIGVWSLGRINQAGVNWGTFPVPYNKTKTSYGHYSPLCVFSKTEYPQESYDFISWACLSNPGQQILVDLGMQQPTRKDLREQFLNNESPPEMKYRQAFYDAFEDQATFRWPGDTIGSYYGGWYQTMLDYWGPYLDQLWIGDIRWEDVATEVRQGSEHILQTGEIS
ncbi:MAG: sugar ABC transporter substrate-binding protein [Caldilineaceae bacterium]|nr:sugar ABC transporter substrate-binding protein [Caldilineaceae bacterium]